ncbi:MAG: FAD-dependent oxidoreductase, partial [Clostridiales bacterium]|nr:FAD-dependent oxidoreductase [Clostridiales bacterium]
DAMPLMGGMLRYGIPEYRLPKAILQQEIDAIKAMGVTFRNNFKIGRDIALEDLRREYDTVIVAVGAWSSVGIGCPGEELEGVLGGIDFLREVDISSNLLAGHRVAVVGGGNTAMDACRTAVRLGAAEVYNVYRRTKNEMPAEKIEIVEAEEEGVIFKNLTNPLEITGEGGKVKAIRLQIMTLGEPDASGRRSPVPLPGREEIIEVDTVIMAIGQKLDGAGLEALAQTRRGNIAADEHTFCTNIDGVFAIGDATNKGADIAVSAIGEARLAVEMIDKYLRGQQVKYEPPFLVKSEKTAQDFSAEEKSPRAEMPHRAGDVRRKDFKEVNFGLSEAEARREANRCLECGCHDYFECKLIGYADRYLVQPEKYRGKTHHRPQEDDHPFIHRNPDKCILCGLCVRICDEVVGATALGLVDRGFDTVVKPALDADLRDTDCISCGQCVNVCPTGALTETMMIEKQVPVKETFTETVCSFCSLGCRTRLATKGSLLVRSLPSSEKGSLLCRKGRFGVGEIAKGQRLSTPLIRNENGWQETSLQQAAARINKRLKDLQAQYGNDSVAVSVSGRCTNEDAYLIREYAAKALKTDNVFSFGRGESGLADVLGRDASTATLDDLDKAELIVAADSGIMKNHGVAGMRIRRAVRKGAGLLLLSSAESLLDTIADIRLDTGDSLSVLRQILLALLNKGCGQGIEGREALQASLAGTSPCEEASAAAELILGSGKTVFLFEKNALTPAAARLIVDMAVLSGGGVLQLLPGANSQGLSDLGVKAKEELLCAIEEGKIKGLLIFGEDVPKAYLKPLDFLAVQDIHLTPTAQKAEVVLPAMAFTESSGSFTGADGIARELKPALASPVAWDNAAQIKALAAEAGSPLPYQTAGELKQAMCKAAAPKSGPVRLGAAEDVSLLYSGNAETDGLYISFGAFLDENGLL